MSAPGWWSARTAREQALLLVAAALALAVLLGLGLLRPAARLAERAQGDAAAAARQLGEVRQLVAAQSRSAAVPARPLAEPLTVLVGRRAGEAGLSLASLEAPDAGRVTLSIPAVRPVVLFPWLDALEARDGLRVETLAVVRNDDASLAVRATLAHGGGA